LLAAKKRKEETNERKEGKLGMKKNILKGNERKFKFSLTQLTREIDEIL
jgi:hypothetical protein